MRKLYRSQAKAGRWAAAGMLLTFLLYAVSFFGIAFSGPRFQWTDLSAYLENLARSPQGWKYLAQTAMLLFGPCYLIALQVLTELAPAPRQWFGRLALNFAIIMVGLMGMHYFLQLSSVRQVIRLEQTEGLEWFVQANPHSASLAIGMLGLTLFFGLSSLFASALFKGGAWGRSLSALFLANGIFCLLGGVGYLFQVDLLTFLTLNLGMGGAVLLMGWLLLLKFNRFLRIDQEVAE